MKTVLITDDQHPGVPRAHRCRLRDRLRTRLRALELDQALAAGADPDSALLLSLRAEELLSSDNRRALARALRRIVRDAGRPAQPLGPVLPLARRGIHRHSGLIQELALILDRPGPVNSRGVAAVEVLLRDGAGPLYTDDVHDALGSRLEAALARLCTPPAGSAVA